MLPRLSVVVCGVALVAGCAAEAIEGGPPGSSSGNAPSGGGGGAGSGSGGTSSDAGAVPGTAGTSSGAGNSSGSAGTPSAAGSAGTGAGGTGNAGSGGSSSGSSQGGRPSLTLPFKEDFEDGTADGFLPWNEDMTQGTWAVVADGGTQVYQPTAAVGDLEFSVGGATAWTDVALEVRVKLLDADSGAQVVVRFKDAKTYLFVEMAEGKYKLRGRASGSTADLVSPSPKPSIVAGTWYTVGIRIKGTNATLTLDDATIGSAACDALISNGGVALGVAEGNVAFDDLSVTAAP